LSNCRNFGGIERRYVASDDLNCFCLKVHIINT
jgi:hypothetical protein